MTARTDVAEIECAECDQLAGEPGFCFWPKCDCEKVLEHARMVERVADALMQAGVDPDKQDPYRLARAAIAEVLKWQSPPEPPTR